MGSKRVSGVTALTVAVVMTYICSLVMVKAQGVEGSGSLDDDEDGFDDPSRTTRLIKVPTPTVGISPTRTVYNPSITMDREADPIYVGLNFFGSPVPIINLSS